MTLGTCSQAGPLLALGLTSWNVIWSTPTAGTTTPEGGKLTGFFDEGTFKESLAQRLFICMTHPGWGYQVMLIPFVLHVPHLNLPLVVMHWHHPFATLRYLPGWGKSVVVGRAKLGGIPMGIISVETRSSDVNLRYLAMPTLVELFPCRTDLLSLVCLICFVRQGSMDRKVPADPANPASQEVVEPQAGQVPGIDMTCPFDVSI